MRNGSRAQLVTNFSFRVYSSNAMPTETKNQIKYSKNGEAEAYLPHVLLE
jgi:hypothetical protein